MTDSQETFNSVLHHFNQIKEANMKWAHVTVTDGFKSYQKLQRVAGNARKFHAALKDLLSNQSNPCPSSMVLEIKALSYFY